MEATREAPRGSEHSFASEAEVTEKFMKLAAHGIAQAHVEALCDRV
jgi:hypothetical protein